MLKFSDSSVLFVPESVFFLKRVLQVRSPSHLIYLYLIGCRSRYVINLVEDTAYLFVQARQLGTLFGLNSGLNEHTYQAFRGDGRLVQRMSSCVWDLRFLQRSGLQRSVVRYSYTDVSNELVGCFFNGLIFDPEDGGDTFLRNVGGFLPNYSTLQSRLYCSSG
jgi:hypothetical protein